MKQYYENNSPEVIKTSERALVELANWWGGRLVAKREELVDTEFYIEIAGKQGLNYPYYVLATRHCNNDSEKQSIVKLGGVIGVPGNFSIATGDMASKQIYYRQGLERRVMVNIMMDLPIFICIPQDMNLMSCVENILELEMLVVWLEHFHQRKI